VKRCLGIAVAALAIAGCKVPPGRPLAPSSSLTVEQFATAVAADAQRSDIETDSTIRNQLAADALRDAQACLERAPQEAACLYSRAIALGLQARAHPLQANDALKSMLEALGAAEAADGEYDQAGPARVKALVLIKAPAWPLGPGDAEAGLTSARRAVALRPQYPPNILALAEALAKNGDTHGAEDAYRRARELSQALPPSRERDDWLREADQALGRGSPSR
jgi:cytochrome c-type biogenesis protein CcmH/NrfG